jgi:hypothetical protein
MSAGDREAVCSALPLATPLALAALQLRADPLFERMTAAQRAQLPQAALDDGAHLAARYRACGCADPWALAERLGVRVRQTTHDGGFGTTVVCAEYQTRSQDIVLYTPVLARVQARVGALLGASPAVALLGRRSVRDIYLAHELYHHLDIARGARSISRRHRVCLLRVGRWRWTSGVSSLAEIGAGAFAQCLLELPFHAKLLDLFVLVDTDASATRRFLAALTAGTGVVESSGEPA